MKTLTARFLLLVAVLVLTAGTLFAIPDMSCCHGVAGSGPCCAHTMACCH